MLGKISFTEKYRWANQEDEEEKQDKEKKTKDILLVCFYKFLGAIFVQFGGISFSYLFTYIFSNIGDIILSLFHLKPVIIKHVE